jgi:hypothetical protein
MSVRELRLRMDSEELSRWLAYDQLDQVPDHVLIGGRVASVVANAMSGGHHRYCPEDFTGRVRPKPRILSGDAGKALFQGVSAMQAAKT